MPSMCAICGTPLFVLKPSETTCLRCRLCRSCSVEFSEKRALQGEKLCERCAARQHERDAQAASHLASLTMEEIGAALKADAPQPVPPTPLASPLPDRYPKYREWIEREAACVVREPIPIMTDFVLAVEYGDIVAKDVRADIDLQRVAMWLKEFLNFSPAADASMDKIMGLRGAGKTPAMQAAWGRRLDRMLFDAMILVRSLDDMATEKAAEIVCAGYEKADPDAWREWKTEAGALARRFRKAGFAHPDFVAVARREVGPFSDEDVGLYLEHFPDEVLTENLKALKKKFQRERRAN